MFGSVSPGCCICFTHVASVFIWMLHMFCNGYTCVSLVFHTYVASILFRCCKSRSYVAHVAVRPMCSSHLLHLLDPPACARVWRGHHGAGAGQKRRGTQSVCGPRCEHEAWCVHGKRSDTTPTWSRRNRYDVPNIRGLRHTKKNKMPEKTKKNPT
jgi:hypothetical protein